MARQLARLFIIAGMLATAALADTPLARGKMLVATEIIQGDVFSKTVIVLLHYDRTGAMGLVVNRPTEVSIDEVLPGEDALSARVGKLYWGGPVKMNSLWGMVKTNAPPPDAEEIVGAVYLVPLDRDVAAGLDESEGIRVFLGYAGWAPGQLDRELATGSWHVVDASEDRVFAADPSRLWQTLAPAEEFRAANGR